MAAGTNIKQYKLEKNSGTGGRRRLSSLAVSRKLVKTLTKAQEGTTTRYPQKVSEERSDTTLQSIRLTEELVEVLAEISERISSRC